MAVVMKCECLANGEPGPAGQWLKDYDPTTGESAWTLDPLQARRFVDAFEAMQLWKSVHRREPVRPDGKANRPLTAFTVTIEPGP